MPKRAPRPTLRQGVGQSKSGRAGEIGAPVDLTGYDVPLKLGAPGRLQWLQFAADPMPWWTEADLPTVAQYCAALDAVERAQDGSAAGWAAASREVRALADALGLTPMARARMGLRRAPGPSSGSSSGGDGPAEGDPAPVIPLGDLVDGAE